MKFPADIVESLRGAYDGRWVCVTGGAGFIGAHLVDALLSLGATIAVLDDLSNATADHTAQLIDLEPERIRFVHASILDDRALDDAFDGASVVFHLAAIGSVQRSVEEPRRAWDVNATGTVRVLEAARRAAVARVVNAGSSSAYGDTDVLPTPEDAPSDPKSPYAASKLAGEAACTAWAHAFGIGAVSLRYFNVFGPRQRADSDYAAVVPAVLARILGGRRPIVYGDGEQSRDFTYIANAVLATLLAGTRRADLKGQAVNIACGTRTSVNDLVRMIADACDSPDVDAEYRPPREGDVRHSFADISRARELLGYEPRVTVREGIAETLAWFRSPARSDR